MSSAADLLLVMRTLDQAGIAAMPIKGPALAVLLYDEPSDRPTTDLDLIVRERDVPAAIETLGTLGLEPRRRSNGLVREIHLVHRHGELCVDLHWNPAGAEVAWPFPVDALFGEAGRVRLPGGSVRFPGMPWLVLITALYLMRELPLIERRYLGDMQRLVPRLTPRHWERARELARQTRTVRLTTLALHLAAAAGDTALPQAALAAFPLRAGDEARLDYLLARLDDPAVETRRPFVSELQAVLGHGRWRESLRDKLRPFALFPLFLLLPDDKDADLAALSGRSPWTERLRRVPQVAKSLAVHRREARARRAFERRLRRDKAVLAPAADVTLHLLGEGAILFRAEGGDLHELGQLAAYAWCRIEDGWPLGELAADLAGRFELAPAVARSELSALLRGWWQAGLLEGAPRAPSPLPEPELPVRPLVPPAPAIAVRLRVLDHDFELGFPDEATANCVMPLLEHFAVPRDAGAGKAESIRVVPDPSGWLVTHEGEVAGRAAALDGLAPQVKAALMTAAINRHGFDLYLHAAMVTKGPHTLLFPASPGSGKSCLSALLAAHGYAYRTDEMVLLKGEGLEARGVPAAITLKQPAWPVIEPFHPRLAALQAHHRVDGKLCRYLPPPEGSPADGGWRKVTHVFLPRYDAGAEPACERLDPLEAFRPLFDQVLAIGCHVDAHFVERLTGWLEGVTVARLTYPDSNSALALVAAALEAPGAGDEVLPVRRTESDKAAAAAP